MKNKSENEHGVHTYFGICIRVICAIRVLK